MSRRDCLLAALVAGLWGFNFVVIEWGMGDVPPLLFLAMRFLVVLVPAILFVPRPDAPWRTILAVGAFMSLGQFGFLYTAMAAGMPAGLAGLVLQAQVVLTILIAAAVLRERPTRAQAVGVGLGVVGLLVVGLGPRRSRPAARPRPVPAGRSVVGDRQRRLPRVGDQGRALAHGLVGTRRAGAARGALARAGRAGGVRRRGGRLRLGGARLHRLHRRARFPGRLRDLQRTAVPQPVGRRWCPGSCWCRRWPSGRRGCSWESSRRSRSWPAARCWCSACWSP